VGGIDGACEAIGARLAEAPAVDPDDGWGLLAQPITRNATAITAPERARIPILPKLDALDGDTPDATGGWPPL
jgi:hypothetical protein